MPYDYDTHVSRGAARYKAQQELGANTPEFAQWENEQRSGGRDLNWRPEKKAAPKPTLPAAGFASEEDEYVSALGHDLGFEKEPARTGKRPGIYVPEGGAFSKPAGMPEVDPASPIGAGKDPFTRRVATSEYGGKDDLWKTRSELLREKYSPRFEGMSRDQREVEYRKAKKMPVPLELEGRLQAAELRGRMKNAEGLMDALNGPPGVPSVPGAPSYPRPQGNGFARAGTIDATLSSLNGTPTPLDLASERDGVSVASNYRGPMRPSVVPGVPGAPNMAALDTPMDPRIEALLNDPVRAMAMAPILEKAGIDVRGLLRARQARAENAKREEEGRAQAEKADRANQVATFVELAKKAGPEAAKASILAMNGGKAPEWLEPMVASVTPKPKERTYGDRMKVYVDALGEAKNAGMNDADSEKYAMARSELEAPLGPSRSSQEAEKAKETLRSEGLKRAEALMRTKLEEGKSPSQARSEVLNELNEGATRNGLRPFTAAEVKQPYTSYDINAVLSRAQSAGQDGTKLADAAVKAVLADTPDAARMARTIQKSNPVQDYATSAINGPFGLLGTAGKRWLAGQAETEEDVIKARAPEIAERIRRASQGKISQVDAIQLAIDAMERMKVAGADTVTFDVRR